jgi:phosphotransferase system enzyme I (PtsP)
MGMGVDNLSMSVACLPRVKWVIRNFTRDQANEFVRDVLAMEDSKAIRRYLDTRLEKVGLGGLIRAGK